MRKKKKYLFIHCTATPEGRDVTSTDIRKMHTLPPPLGRGWKQLGYRTMFYLNGDTEDLIGTNGDEYIDSWEITNGVKGLNDIAEHVVYVGGLDKNLKPKDTRTAKQLLAMKRFVEDYKKLNPDIIIKGHNEVANKACPCFDVQLWLTEIGVQNEE